MNIVFKNPDPSPEPSLAYKLQAEGNIRWRQLSACKLTYENNPAERIAVWVAEKPRTAVIEVSEPDYEADTRFKAVYA